MLNAFANDEKEADEVIQDVQVSEEDIKETDETPLEKNYKGMGVTAGFLSGLGFTYRQYFADRWAYKATGVGFFDQNQTFWNLGLQGMYIISENNWLRFYSLAGISSITTKRRIGTPIASPPPDNYSYDYVDIPPRYSSNNETYNNVGVGIGLEFGRLAPGLSLALELPLIFSFRNVTLNSFYPIPQVSLIYNF